MKKLQRVIALVALLLSTVLLPLHANGAKKLPAHDYILYVGTYTDGPSKGIYAFRYAAAKDQFTPLGLMAATTNPSFLTVHPNHRFLYAVNEIQKYDGPVGAGLASGGVSAFSIDQKTGKLTLSNEVASGGADPCYVTLDKTGKYVLVANYTGGNVSVFPLRDDGRLEASSAFVQHHGTGVNPQRQEGPHAHSIDLSPDNRFAIAADLGLDELIAYHFDGTKGFIASNDSHFTKVAGGAGPRHFTFHPNGRFAYVINEMQSSVTAFSYDAPSGTLSELQTLSILPKDFAGRNDAAEIEVHPSGKFLYASNRGHDSIAVFAIDSKKGTLKFLQDVPTIGKEPRNFAIDPSGSRLYVANQHSGNVIVFHIDAKTGHLSPTGKVLEVSSPVCIRFLEVE